MHGYVVETADLIQDDGEDLYDPHFASGRGQVRQRAADAFQRQFGTTVECTRDVSLRHRDEACRMMVLSKAGTEGPRHPKRPVTQLTARRLSGRTRSQVGI